MGDFWVWICDHVGISGTFFALFLITFVQIVPIKINPWTAIFNYFSAPTRMANELKSVKEDISNIKIDADKLAGITQKVEVLNTQISDLNAKILDESEQRKQDRAEDARRDILKFGDDIARGQHLSYEHYTEILRLIDVYEAYCDAHPQFKNSTCVLTIKGIKQAYQQEFFNLHN